MHPLTLTLFGRKRVRVRGCMPTSPMLCRCSMTLHWAAISSFTEYSEVIDISQLLIDLSLMRNFGLVISITEILFTGLPSPLAPAMTLPCLSEGRFRQSATVTLMAVPYVKICAPQCFTLAISVPFESAFKATQRTKIPLVVSSVTFTTNTFLNYVLIFGKFGAPALGISGAAAATLTARVFEVLLSFYFATRKDNALHDRR